MDSKFSAKLVSLSLIVSICFLGYTLSSSRADIGGVNGQVAIDDAVIIRQGNGVNYSFSNDAYLTKLEVKSASIELNDWLEIGATTTSGQLNNVLKDYRADYIRWSAHSTDSTATVTYAINGLRADTRYDVFCDSTRYRIVNVDSAKNLQFSYADGWSDHEFIITKSSEPPLTLQASFEYVITGNLIMFTDKSYGEIVKWVWNFGDGFGSTERSPSHEYKASGKYTISLTVYDSEGHSSKASIQITLKLGPGFPVERDEGGWNVYITDNLTLSVSAVALGVGGAIFLVSAKYMQSVPLITPNGRRLLGLIMLGAAAYYFVVVDNSWFG